MFEPRDYDIVIKQKLYEIVIRKKVELNLLIAIDKIGSLKIPHLLSGET